MPTKIKQKETKVHKNNIEFALCWPTIPGYTPDSKLSVTDNYRQRENQFSLDLTKQTLGFLFEEGSCYTNQKASNSHWP